MSDDYTLVRSEIAHLVGTPVDDWSASESAAVEASIRRGIHNACHPGNHQWSWMRPVHRFTTASGQRRYPLPSDFEQFINDISFDGVNYQYSPISQKPATRLLQLQSEHTSTGTPCYFATENPVHDGVNQQYQELVLHPTPDNAYPLIGIYQVGPIRPLSSSHPYFPGGPANKELFLQSCLAATESKFFDKQGEKHTAFQATLAIAIAEDLRRQPRNLGQLGGQRGRVRGDVRSALGWRLSTLYNGGTDL
jgi:hypothetical protein